jgi:hypothetical protein
MVETEHQVPAYVSMVSYDGALGCGYLHSAAAFPCASQFCASSKLNLSCMVFHNNLLFAQKPEILFVLL